MANLAMNPTGDRHLQTLLTLGAVGQRTDAELLAAFLAGLGRADAAAELAFAALVDRHGTAVLRAARLVLGDEASSLDASQATFLILARKAQSLRVGDSLAPWLVAVARRVALSLRKQQARRRRHEQTAARPEAVAPRDDAARTETIRLVLAEVARLPEPYRAAVVACHLDGLSQQGAADRLGCPLGTLQSRLDRGRRHLRARLARRGLAPSALGLLPPAGLPLSFPPTLITPLARAATLWAIGSATSIAPSVLALLPTAKGFTMTKLLGTAALTIMTAIGLAATTTAPGFIDQPGDSKVTTNPGLQTATSQEAPPVPTTAPGDGARAGSAPGSDKVPHLPTVEDEIPPPVEGPGSVAFLCFTTYDGRPPSSDYTIPHLDRLTARGYPLQVVDLSRNADLAIKHGVKSIPTYILTGEASGGRINGIANNVYLANEYNRVKREAISQLSQSDPDIPRPAFGPGLQTLLCFGSIDAEEQRPIAPMVNELLGKGYPVRQLGLERNRDLVGLYQIKQYPTFVLIDQAGQEFARTNQPRSARQLAEFHNRFCPEAPPTPTTDEPKLTIPPVYPRPWETAARIKIHLSDKEWGFSSGTIIASDRDQSIVLTAAHPFKVQQGKYPSPGRFGRPVAVDLFDGRIAAAGIAQVACIEHDLVGEVLAIWRERNLALIRIKPKRVWPASPIAGGDLTLAEGNELISVGCSHGNDATAWDTRVLSPQVKMTTGSTTSFMVKCTNQPAEGRSGGGLFTPRGYLVGICEFADPNEKVGLYTMPGAIQDLNKFLSWHDGVVTFDFEAFKDILPEYALMVTATDAKSPPDAPSGEPTTAPPVSTQDRRLDELERKLDRVLESLDNIRGGAKSGEVAPAPAPAPR